MQLILELRGVEKRFGGVVALDKAELLCPAGKIVGLIGANGSGKSTMSRIINGTLQPDAGEFVYQGKRTSFRSPMEAARAGISMVYQNLSLVPDLSVWQNIWLGTEPLRPGGFLDDRTARARATELTRELCGWLQVDRPVGTLLPAEKQLVEIVKCLARNPQLLILDEPTAPLERAHVDLLFSLLRKRKVAGRSTIFISHRMTEVTEICDYLVVFRNGRTAGTIDFERENKDERRIIELMTGEPVEVGNARPRTATGSRPILEVQGLTLPPKLRGVSLTVHAGEIVGLAGLQGQGQEELMLALAGFRRFEGGRLAIDGEARELRHPSDAIRAGVALVPGDRHHQGLFLNHTVYLNAVYCRTALPKTPWFMNRAGLKEAVRRLCADLRVKTPSIFTPVGELSGGNQQKVVVANWLPLDPKVLLLSDPAKGVDVQAKAELYDLLRRLAERGTGVLLYASDNEELLRACDRILVIYEGSIVGELANRGLTERDIVDASVRSEPKGGRDLPGSRRVNA
ncbi:MAG TPA: sugar ABC transporter ATP-binding protein [Anaeromyxobacter sp.]|nr:sugar ABC transporter ATP-binding protein [Anaeromyxobacter sp.]